MKTLVVVEPRVFRAVWPEGEIRSVCLDRHVLPPLVSLEVGESEVEGVGHSGHVWGADIPIGYFG